MLDNIAHLSKSLWTSKRTLIIILAVGLLQGLIYTFFVPPWWNYDEPGHFEFAWQIAHFDHWPQKGEVDEGMRRLMAASMLQYHWYDIMSYKPDLTGSQPVKTDLAGTQWTPYPLYYIIVSLPLRLIGGADFAIQDRVARLVSVLMLLITIVFAWQTLAEFLPDGHPLPWMTTLLIATLPGFVNVMTSVNDDVGAIMFMSLFLWVSIRLIQRGFSWPRLAAFVLSLAVCYWTKNTAWVAFLLAPIVLLITAFKNRFRWLPIAILSLLLISFSAYAFRLNAVAQWYQQPYHSQTPIYPSNQAPWGHYVFRFGQADTGIGILKQPIPIAQISSIRGKTLTMGAWMWADQPVKVHLPFLTYTLYPKGTNTSPIKTVTLTSTPVFYRFTFEAPVAMETASTILLPFITQTTGNNVIYCDGIVLAEGNHSSGEPRFQDASATGGTWNGITFKNFIRNGSAETTWLRLTPELESLIESKVPYGSPNNFLISIADPQVAREAYQGAAAQLFDTFFGKIIRDKVNLPGSSHTYTFLGFITLLSGICTLYLLWRTRKKINWHLFLFLGISFILVWGITFARTGMTIESIYPTGVWARYAFPAIIPSVLLLCVGWWEGLRLIGERLRISPWHQGVIFAAFLAGLDIFALLGIAKYFYWNSGQEYVILFFALVGFLAFAFTSLASLKENKTRS
jgi:Dolichyl-phosphate-mannose-protein mannosyltransferase